MDDTGRPATPSPGPPAGSGPGSSAGSPTMGGRTAAALVFGSSAAVLVVELVALRLLAPYLGLTLETNTLVIAIALGAIAAGSWLGGRAADAVPPARVLGSLLGVSGVVVAATPFAVRAAGAGPDAGLVVPVAALTILVPGLLLSAVTPMVTKLRLTTLAETGAVVGRLSGVGTAGAIAGTVLTGFVLISRLSVTAIMVGLGVLLVLAAVALEVRRVGAAAAVRSAGPAAVLVALGGVGGAVGPGGCDAETTYHCASVEADDGGSDGSDGSDGSGGRTLVLDGLRHSYVDLDDPTRLEFDYVLGLAATTQAVWPQDEPLVAHHLGGGGLTLPRWLAAERPGTTSTVSEIDPGVVALDRERLGLETGPDLQVRVEDARVGLREVPDDSQDLVVGDAFGGISVPWHLTTREMVAEIDRVLAPDGVYAANLIDHGPLAFARAEVATLAERFDHVWVLAEPGVVTGETTRADGRDPDGGNLVAVASDRSLSASDLTDQMRDLDLGWVVATGPDVAAWVDGADVLTDDRAPVDQLLTPYSTTPSSQSR